MKKERAGERAEYQHNDAKMTHPLIEALAKSLQRGKTASTERILNVMCSRPQLITRRFDEIERLIDENGQSALLKAAVVNSLASMDHPQQALRRLKSFAEKHSLGNVTGDAAADDKRESTRSAVSTNVGNTLVQRAERLAKRISVNPAHVQTIYTHRQRQLMTVQEWEKGFRFAAALEQITMADDFEESELAAFMHPHSQKKLRDVETDDRGGLVVVGHTGFTAPRNYFIKHLIKDAIPFRRALNRPPYVWELNDSRTALFCCLRALSAGTSVVMAPDGPLGEVRAPIKLLSRVASIATGAALLAHETKSEVTWLNIEFKDGYFEPVLVKGPRSEPGEKQKAYQERFVRFYESMLTNYFTGNPYNMVLRSRWRSTFKNRAEDQDKTLAVGE